MTLLENIFVVCFILGILALILTRIVATGDKSLPVSIYTVFLAVFFTGLVFYGTTVMGISNFVILFLIALVIPTLGEILALKIGFVGRYNYSDQLGFKLPGGLPLVVAVMWSAILIVIYWFILAVYQWGFNYGLFLQLRAPGSESGLLACVVFSLLAGVMCVILDLVLDPVMKAKEFWSWKYRGGWYGVPWANYIGWFLTGFAVIFIFSLFIDPFAPLIENPFSRHVQGIFVLIYPVMLIDLSITSIQRKIFTPALICIPISLAGCYVAVEFWLS